MKIGNSFAEFTDIVQSVFAACSDSLLGLPITE